MKKISNLLIMFFVVMAIGAVNASAQNALVRNSNIDLQPGSSKSAAVKSTAPVTPATQAVINSLSTLPEADMLVYLNPQRILNELVPKVLPAKDVEGMRKGFEESSLSTTTVSRWWSSAGPSYQSMRSLGAMTLSP